MSHPRRVFVDFPVGTHPQHGTEVALSKSDSHHFRSVLRLTQGSAITVVDRASAKEFDAILSSAEDPVIARVLHEKRRAQPTSRVASLTFALAKGKNTDLVCEKACELGVGHIVLWQSERSVVRIDSENDRQKKLSRWQSIVESAAKQCGNDSIPRISVALDLKSLLDELSSLRSADDRAFICSLAPGAKLPAELTPPTNRVHLAVGAEGDFTDKEEATLCESGFEKLSLGPLVLRCETAAIVAISMVHGAWGFLPTSEES